MTTDASESPSLAKPMKRCNKPLMERRRRERINRSLEDLKSLILQTSNKDSAQYSKLEKADILEMTVKHLKNVRRQQVASVTGSSAQEKFHSGFKECANEVGRYMNGIDGLSSEIHSRLQHHLGNCISMGRSPSGQNPVPMATQVNSLPGVGVRIPSRDQLVYVSMQNTQTGFPSEKQQPLYCNTDLFEGHIAQQGLVSRVFSLGQTGLLSLSQNRHGAVMTGLNTCSEQTHLPVAPPSLQVVEHVPSNVWRPW